MNPLRLILSVCLIKSLEAKIRTADAFMSSADLQNIFKLEQALVGTLRNYKEQLDKSLYHIRHYVSEVEELYKNEDCYPLNKCDDQSLQERIVSNPIYNYQMLKRLLVYWKSMEETIKKIDSKQTLTELNKLKHRFGGMPHDRDLQGAAKALIRLRSTYKFDLNKLSQGNIHGLQTGAHLTSKDSFFLGKFAFSNGNYVEAQRWLEFTAWQMAASEEVSNHTGTTNSVSSENVDKFLRDVRDKLESNELIMDDEDGSDNDLSKYPIGIVPPKTNDRNKMITSTDKNNFKALCRGLKLLPIEKTSKLTCYYQLKAKDPFFWLQPFKVEVHHDYPHRIVSFYDVISDQEADSIVGIAHPRMMQASVGHGKEVSEGRVSRNCWIKDFESALVDKISARINWITGLQTSRPLDVHGEGKEEEYEPLQVANYGIGGFYESHQDPMFVYKEPDFLVHSVQETNPAYVTGDRLGTFMLYLSEVPLGGWTAFPRLGIAVKPTKGSAVYWHNLRRSGKSDMHMLHGGCPVVVGSKWVGNKWIREFAQVFHNKCVDNIDK